MTNFHDFSPLKLTLLVTLSETRKLTSRKRLTKQPLSEQLELLWSHESAFVLEN